LIDLLQDRFHDLVRQLSDWPIRAGGDGGEHDVVHAGLDELEDQLARRRGVRDLRQGGLGGHRRPRRAARNSRGAVPNRYLVLRDATNTNPTKVGASQATMADDDLPDRSNT
jgi:hypothetical protein